MFNHEPPDYPCPFCALLAGVETAIDSARDIVVRTQRATALIASGWWPNNPGHVHVLPRYHDDNLAGSRPLPGYVPDEQREAYADALRRHLT